MLSQSKSKDIWIIILCMRGLMLSEGGSYRVMSSVQWGWFSHPSGRSISHLWGSSTILGEKHPCLKKSQICIDPQLLSELTKFQPWQIIHYDIQRWNIHATCHGMACPSVFKYSNLRQVSRPKYEISVSPCDTKSRWNIQFSATCHTTFPATDAKTSVVPDFTAGI